MESYTLKSISVEEAKQKQFKLIDEITKEFNGYDFLQLGDLGVERTANKPKFVTKVEKVIAQYFNAESCVLLVGAGTGAIRYGLTACDYVHKTILVHKAPIYPTTLVTIEMLGLKIIEADFNDKDDIIKVLSNNLIDAAIVQHTRQKLEDKYDLEEVIATIKGVKDIPIVIDDNYAVMKVAKMGSELGADLSAFSSFKLLGPEGVGILVGKKKYIDKIEKMNYSGGSKVQGWQAREVLVGLTYAPVALAIQAEVLDSIMQEINDNKIEGVKNATVANAQSKVLLVELEDNIAKKVLEEAAKLGAAPYPIGAESKYEIAPMFYQVSGTFKKYDATLVDRMVRINPMRSGKDTVLRILKESIQKAKQ